jgi:hypothetical protein
MEIQTWIENSKVIPAVQERVYNGKRYVLIAEGAKPTGGYSVTVQSIAHVNGHLEVLVKSTSPAPGDMVTQALTYPYDLIVVNNNTTSLEFKDVDDPYRHFYKLIGLGYINQAFVESSNWINLLTPAGGSIIAQSFILSGLATSLKELSAMN